MKITYCDTPSSRASGIVNEAISGEQHAELAKIGEAFWLVASPNLSEEIEAVKIEAAYINHENKMTAVRFRIAFNPFLRFKGHQSAKIINLSGLWDIDRKIFWYTHEDISGTIFPTNSGSRFDLTLNTHEEVARCLLWGLTKVIEKTSYSLNNEAKHLADQANRVRGASIQAITG